MKQTIALLIIAFLVLSCNNNNEDIYTDVPETYPAVQAEFGNSLD